MIEIDEWNYINGLSYRWEGTDKHNWQEIREQFYAFLMGWA